MPKTVADIDALLRERHLLKHPFYVAWSRGEVPIETLRSYAAQYYQFEANFPRYVARAYSHVLRPEERRTLLENLVDEEGRPPTHPELWLDFARGIGASPRAVRRASPLRATRDLLACYERFGDEGAGPALAALYAYESIFPEVAAEKSRGLREEYGIRDRPTHEFFRVHTGADVEHARAERRLLSAEMRRSRGSGDAAYRAAKATIDAWWSFLDSFPCA
jgi:pyrroloquinoline-quinone synthase